MAWLCRTGRVVTRTGGNKDRQLAWVKSGIFNHAAGWV